MEEFMFNGELEKLQAVKIEVASAAMKKMNPTVHTMARQFFDHLDASALFLQQLGNYISKLPDKAEGGGDGPPVNPAEQPKGPVNPMDLKLDGGPTS